MCGDEYKSIAAGRQEVGKKCRGVSMGNRMCEDIRVGVEVQGGLGVLA